MSDSGLKNKQQPNPMRRAELGAEIHQLQAREQTLLAKRREIAEHSQTLIAQMEHQEHVLDHALDSAELLALETAADLLGGALPDPVQEKRRQDLRQQLGRPGEIALSLQTADEQIGRQLEDLRPRLERAEQDLAKHDQAVAEWQAAEKAELEAARAAEKAGTATPAQRDLVRLHGG